MDTYGLVAMEPLQPEVGSRERSGLSWGEPAIRPWPTSAFQPGEGGETGPEWPLTHIRSPRDNRSYRAAFAHRNRPTGDPHDYHRQRPADRPQPAGRCAGPARRRPGGADALESVLSDNTRRVYGAQWQLFNEWCDSVDLRSLPAEPLTVARYLAVRAGDGASVATLRLAASAIAKAHEWAGHESPCRDPGVRASLRGRGRRLARPQRQAGALTADVLAVIRLTAVQSRLRGRGIETPAQAAERARFDLALVAVLSDGGLRRSEAAALTWGDVQRWDDGSGRITVIR